MGTSDSKGRFKGRLTVDTWLAASTIILGLAIWLLVPYQVDEPMSFFGQVNAGLDPKLFPQIAAAGFVITGVFYLVTSFGMPREAHFDGSSVQTFLSMGLVLLIMVGYVALLRPLGFIVSSGLASLAIALLYGSRNVFGIAMVAVVVPVCIFYLFTRLLSVSLPPIPGLGQ